MDIIFHRIEFSIATRDALTEYLIANSQEIVDLPLTFSLLNQKLLSNGAVLDQNFFTQSLIFSNDLIKFIIDDLQRKLEALSHQFGKMIDVILIL